MVAFFSFLVLLFSPMTAPWHPGDLPPGEGGESTEPPPSDPCKTGEFTDYDPGCSPA